VVEMTQLAEIYNLEPPLDEARKSAGEEETIATMRCGRVGTAFAEIDSTTLHLCVSGL
jgi:hypothetical protein